MSAQPAYSHHAEVLLVTNAYPSESAIYRNGFIHRRVRAYLARGIEVEIFYLHPPVTESYNYFFDGVKVTVGNEVSYEQRIATVRYRKILVHFASPAMIEPILKYQTSTPVIVWVHGFEAEAWHRRWFNFVDSAAQIRAALSRKSEFYAEQNAFIGWLISTDQIDVRIVHVSDWFRKNIVEPDARRATRTFDIIPNYVDEELFKWSKKREDDRLKVLSLRPYASRKYANDQMVGAILELAKRPYFERLSFTICGEGEQFAPTVERVAGFLNVTIHEGFIPQQEIPALHRDHGIFLAPTRFDSQGVSMCEAMACGLVPVSSRIAAIPEFVDEGRSGLLAKPEDTRGIADRIEALYYDPEMYLRMSEAAAISVREQCGYGATIQREIELIGGNL